MHQETPADDNDSAHILVSSFSVAYRGHTARHCMRASRGLVDLKPRKQIVCSPRFELSKKEDK